MTREEEFQRLNQQALQLYQQGRYEEAISLSTRSLELARQIWGEGHPDYATILSNLAELHRAMGDYAAAEPLLRRALEIRRVALGEGHPDYAQSLNNLAELHKAMGD